MRLLIWGVVVTALLLAFVFTWIYLASQGRVPIIQAPLETVSPAVRIVALVLLAAIVGWVYLRLAPRTRQTD